jgi:hypothetical protein
LELMVNKLDTNQIVRNGLVGSNFSTAWAKVLVHTV